MAAERYIEEMNEFQIKVLQCKRKSLLLFFHPEVRESLEFGTMLEEVIKDHSEEYKIVGVDISTKKTLADIYEIKEVPSVVMICNGEKMKQLECSFDKQKIKHQLW